MTLAARDWVNKASEARVQNFAAETASAGSLALLDRLETLAERNRQIHEDECFNLNPATNVMNPKAEALLSSKLAPARRLATRVISMKWGWRPSKR